MHASRFSHVWLFVTLWTVARQAPLSMGFSRQEHWSGLLCPPTGSFPDLGMKPASLTSPALADRFFTRSATWKPSGAHKMSLKYFRQRDVLPPKWSKARDHSLPWQVRWECTKLTVFLWRCSPLSLEVRVSTSRRGKKHEPGEASLGSSAGSSVNLN